MASPLAGVFALGECAEVSGTNYQLVEPIYQQAEVLAKNLCGTSAHIPSVVQGSHLKVEDVPLFFAGVVPPEIDTHDAIIEDSGQRVYRRLCLQDGVLRGAVLYGDTLGARDIQNHINTAISPSQAQSLAFGLKAA
jgi:nitrite reductase (NADH) large subunit